MLYFSNLFTYKLCYKLRASLVCLLQAPVNDSGAAAGFIGIKPTTRPTHLVRAVLESVALRVAQVYRLILQETHYKCSLIRSVDYLFVTYLNTCTSLSSLKLPVYQGVSIFWSNPSSGDIVSH